jgi:dTDP-4-amino-4,6-dideoxygalactose transaminase
MKLIPRLKPYYTLQDWKAAFSFFAKNPVERYEREFAGKFSRKYGVMFQHGRTGLYALLKTWELEDAEVICPAYTCVVVPNAIVLSGNIPIFVDCAPSSFNMDLERIEEAITKKTRVIIATHLFGYPMDVEKLDKIVDEAEKRYGHKIYIIQDVAHSYGAKWHGKLVTEYGDAAIFGSNISKIINSIFGGMVICDDPEIYQKLIEWRREECLDGSWLKETKRLIYFVATNIALNSYVYGFVNWLERKGLLDRFVKYYEEDRIEFPDDWNMLPSNIEARVGLSQLQQYDKIVNGKISKVKEWRKKLADENVTFLPDIEGATYSHCTGLVDNREEWVERYRQQGIQLGIIIEYSIPYMKAYRKYKRKEYPVSLDYSRKTINFPNWLGVDI